MKVAITSAVELQNAEGLRRKFVRALQFEMFAFELLEACARRSSGPTLPRIPLRLAHPSARRLERASELSATDRLCGSTLRRIFVDVVEHDPHGAFTQLLGVLAGS
jgi:hypothetical protein